MKKFYLFTGLNRPLTYFLFLSLLAAGIACKKDKYSAPDEDQAALDSRHHHDNDFKFTGFSQVNLVANNANYGAVRVDSALVNAWGLAFSTGGVAWISSQGGHASTVYNSEGNRVLGPVLIPSPGGLEGGSPTGVVLNPLATDFLITSGNGTPDAAGRFLFVGDDGVVSAWNPTWGTHAFTKYVNTATSSYTGLTLANNAGSNYLYAADFKAGKIAVWDKNWTPVTSFPFKDWRLPRGYAPFNIQVVGTQLFVTYAKVGRDGEEQTGRGKGIVNIFTTDGKLVKRFAEEGKLNAPWGIAQVPATFFPQRMDPDDDDHSCDHVDAQPAILVGNFGDGRINIYSLRGKFLGQLKSKKHVLEIEGLWAISLPPLTSTIDQKRLYFNAGPDDEKDGLFGYIIQDSVGVKISGGDHY